MYHWIFKMILWEIQRGWVTWLWAQLITDRDWIRILVCLAPSSVFLPLYYIFQASVSIVNIVMEGLDATLGMKDVVTLGCKSPICIAWTEESRVGQGYGPFQWLISLGYEGLASNPNSANSEVTTPCRVDWGLHGDCITVRLVALSNSASLYTPSWLLLPGTLPNKLSAC